jgi:hypothetical protein
MVHCHAVIAVQLSATQSPRHRTWNSLRLLSNGEIKIRTEFEKRLQILHHPLQGSKRQKELKLTTK